MSKKTNPNKLYPSPYDPDDKCWTLLHLAATESETKAVAFLIRHGFDVNAVTGKGETPLHLVAGPISFYEIVKLLLESGAKPNIEDDNGCTPLFNAVSGDNIAATLLLEHGAKVNFANKEGWTALHVAARLDQRKNVQFLIANGAEVNVKDANGKTPLDIAWGKAADFLRHYQHRSRRTLPVLKGGK